MNCSAIELAIDKLCFQKKNFKVKFLSFLIFKLERAQKKLAKTKLIFHNDNFLIRLASATE